MLKLVIISSLLCTLVLGAPLESNETEPVQYQITDFHEVVREMKACNEHRDCSCLDGIPVCHLGECHCIYSQIFCRHPRDCQHKNCDYGRAKCYYNVCLCQKEPDWGVRPMMENSTDIAVEVLEPQ